MPDSAPLDRNLADPALRPKREATPGARARQGLIDVVPVVVAILPVGLLFGALSVAKGITVLDAVLMSATMYAGASQLVAIDLFGQSIPFWAIVLSVFAVNFRHILYSAALTPIVKGQGWLTKLGVFALLVDPQFAMTERRHEQGHRFSKAW
ncbi:MAG: AzlC family ABC transporter permease, partial [Pseudomonadota bacterium]